MDEWIGKPPTPHRKTGQILICFHNVDGLAKDCKDLVKGHAEKDRRKQETREYVAHLGHLETDMAALIDTRLDHRESSQSSITGSFYKYRHGHTYNANTASTHTRTNPTIGEINIVTTPEVKGYTVGQPIQDFRRWSRWIGHKLQGPKTYISSKGRKIHRKIAIIAVYGPCETSSVDEGESSRAWHTQSLNIAKLPEAERETNPTMQFLHDLHTQVKELERSGHEVIIGGDWNVPAMKTTGRGAKARAAVLKLFIRGGIMCDVHTELNRNYSQPVNPIAIATHGEKAKRRHTYQHGGALTNPDFILASTTLLEHNALTQCAIQLEYHKHSPVHSMHLPMYLTIDLSLAFSVNRTWLTTSKAQRIMPMSKYQNVPKLSIKNKKQVKLCKQALVRNTPDSLKANTSRLLSKILTQPSHQAFAKHADPTYPTALADRYTEEDHETFKKCWNQVNRTIIDSIREGCPTPKRKQNKVMAWTAEYITKMKKLRVLGRLKDAYIKGKSPDSARYVARNMTKYIAKCKLNTLIEHPLPTSNQRSVWGYWCSEIDREIALCRRARHHKERQRMKANVKGNAKLVEDKRKRGAIKQAIRFALRRYNTPQTLTEVTETVPDTTDERVHFTNITNLECGRCGKEGCEHCVANISFCENECGGSSGLRIGNIPHN